MPLVFSGVVAAPVQTLAEIQRSLPVDSALLEYYLGERESYLWLVRASEIRSFRLPPRNATVLSPK